MSLSDDAVNESNIDENAGVDGENGAPNSGEGRLPCIGMVGGSICGVMNEAYASWVGPANLGGSADVAIIGRPGWSDGTCGWGVK